MHPVDAPIRRALRCQFTLIAAQKEWGPCGPIRSFYFDQAFMAVRVKRVDVVAGPVSVFLCHPSDLSRKVFTISLSELLSFNVDYKGLTGFSERAVAVVSLYRIKFPYEPPQPFWNRLFGCR